MKEMQLRSLLAKFVWYVGRVAVIIDGVYNVFDMGNRNLVDQ